MSDLQTVGRFVWAKKALENYFSETNRVLTVFDIGAGKELVRSFVTSQGHEYCSFDIKPSNEQVRLWNIEHEFPYKEKADVIIFLEVVEHLNNPWIGMKNLIDVLKEGGILILTTPNPTWSDSRVHMFIKGTLTMFKERDLDSNHHVFTPWHFIVRKLLKDVGFKKLSFYKIGKKTKITEAPFWSISLPLRIVYRFIKIIIEKINPLSIGDTYGVIAVK
jgi:2-polyprenyl-3-methyl-5-hydroxy-6-metoxy-1,4-benzoquinol methylase